MANEEHVARLRQGVGVWNAWREKEPSFSFPDLRGVDLRGANLSRADLSGVNLRGADLSKAVLIETDLSGADLSGARLNRTVFGNVDLSETKGLGQCVHRGPCFFDHQTLQRSGPLPLVFQRGIGLPDQLETFMANEEHVARLRQGVGVWNAWREKEPSFSFPDLRGADLRGADLRRADLSDAVLIETDLIETDLSGARLIGTDLREAVLRGADLSGANLRGADLTDAVLIETDLSGADLSGARLNRTVFGNVDLSETKGLGQCVHRGPCFFDHQTLQRSGPLPLVFQRGIGLPDQLIEYLPSLLNQPVQFYSCFISYSSKDQGFAERLYADLQNEGVRCWFAPHDLLIGAKIWDALDEAIRLRDKVLLILSEGAIASDWVEDEVSKAFAEERERKQTMLFPVRLDDVVLQTSEPWARELRDQRHIGDFTRWKDHDAYRKSLERLMRDLTVQRVLESQVP